MDVNFSYVYKSIQSNFIQDAIDNATDSTRQRM